MVTLASAPHPGGLASVYYTKPASNPLKAAGADGAAVYSFEQFPAGRVRDVTAPSVVPHDEALVIAGTAHRIDGVVPTRIAAGPGGDPPGESAIIFYFDEALDPTSVPAKAAFTLSGDTGDKARTMDNVAGITVVGNALVMTTNVRFRLNRNYTIVYTKPAADPLQDSAGNTVAGGTWTARAFHNGQPVPRGVTVKGDVARISMQHVLNPDSVPAPSAFTLWRTDTETVDDVTTRSRLSPNFRVVSVSVESTFAVLRLLNPILPCDGTHPFRVSYEVPSVNRLRTIDGQGAESWGPEKGGTNNYARATNDLASQCARIQ
ncbi:MAG: Ig-like domain-containing protein [Alphaproteobacteria bacterium]|nr:Ig-like domain-containing protein [Alphaproteobacteria bacterium]